MNKILNYTPHDITIIDDNYNTVKVLPSQGNIRLSSVVMPHDIIDGIKVTKTVFGIPDALPPEQEGRYYIVSQLVKRSLEGKRDDLLVPTQVIKDSNGRIIGCQSLGL